MALIDIPGGLWIPPLPTSYASAPSLSQPTTTSNAAGKAAVIVQAPKDGDIRKVIWGTRTVTTGATIDVRLETIDLTTGFPSGTLFGTNTNGSQVVANGDDNVVFTTTLTADATVAKGDFLAVVFANSGSGNLQMPTGLAWGQVPSYPYFAFHNGTSYSMGNQAIFVMVAFEYDDGSYAHIPGVVPAGIATTSNQPTTATTPDVVGLRFQMPVPCRVAGAWAQIDFDGDWELKLVTTAYHQGNQTGILASIAVDKELRRTNAAAAFPYLFDTPVEIDAATNYRLLAEPTTATAISVYDTEYPSLASLDALPGGRDFHFTTAKDPTADGSWTNYNSGTFRVPFMGVFFDQIADDAGGGGGDFPAPIGGGLVAV